ncbi:MAG: hypothetical protein JW915_00185 [Chitinispirillaceae bacterium]|nr:hypothetical protein [Chitinispirillaceae bacterium]
MATVNNIRLNIERADQRNRRLVNVSYRVCFTSCEMAAGSTFREKVTLRGDDPIWDDHLLTLRDGCIKVSAACVERSFKLNVASSTLDEDPDTIILGWVIGNKDEIYARVSLTPFVPTGSSGDSNIVIGDFGPAGA